jgi:CRP-like cAMP-binding protein
MSMAELGLEKSNDAAVGSGNRLLDFFLKENRGLQSALQLVSFRAGQVVYRQDRPISYAYFPLVGALALTLNMRDGAACGAIAVGNEGLIGLPLYFGQSVSPYTVIQQTEGKSYRVGAPTFLGSIRRSLRLQTMMQCYCEYSMRFTHQTAACNTLHTIKQRACRWLLLVQDRAGTEQFELPQATLAEMLGVRRQSVSEVAGELRRMGLIEYSRGLITIIDRRKLEEAGCCECYEIMNVYYRRLLDPFIPASH